MDIRICALLLLVAVVGSYGEFYSSARQRRSIEGSAGHKVEYYEPVRIEKRAADEKNDTKSNDDTKDASTTTSKTTTPTSGTTVAPKSTEATTKPSTETTTNPTSSKSPLASRSAFEDKDDTPSKPSNNEKKPEQPGNEKDPSVSSRMNPDSGLNPAAPSLGSQPMGNNPFPGYNSIPSYGPNYAFTSTNEGPGGSASASAGSFASAGGYPSNTGFPSFNSFYDPSYNTNGYVWPTDSKKATNDAPQDKPVTNSRSNFDTNDKPANNAGPVQNPNSLPSSGPQNFPTRGSGGPYTPNFNYPAANSGQGPNYAWTNSGPGYSGAAAGAFAGGSGTPTFNSRGAFSGNNAGAGFPDNSAYTPGTVDRDTIARSNGTGFAFPQPVFGPSFDQSFAIQQRIMDDHFRNLQAQIEAHQRAIQQANQLNSIYGSGGSSDSGWGSSNPGVQSAAASINLGPRGGFQAAEISPVGPGIESRFAEDLPAPSSGGSYGVFASSSSSSKTGPDGKVISHKSATTGVNDNGKISFRTVKD